MKRQMKKVSVLFAGFLVVSLVVGLVVFEFGFVPVAYANPDWLSGWTYRKSHVINYATGAGTLYQMNITVYYTDGTDSLWKVYLNEKCRTDFGDIRFTDNDEVTLLDYWMESKTDSNNAVFWVEVADSLESAAQTIYVYYGKADATTTSSGTNTFLIFNDGSSVAGWTEYDVHGNPSWAATGGAIRATSGGIGTGGKLFCNALVGINNYVVNVKIKADIGLTVSNYQQGIAFEVTRSTTDHGYARWIDHSSLDKWTILGDTAETQSAADANFDASAWHKYTFIKNVNNWKLYVDDSLKVSRTETWNAQYVGLYAYFSAASHTVDYDDFRVCKYVSPEPSHGSWGSEETANTAPTNDACDSTATFTVNVDAWVNMTVSDANLVADLFTVDIQVNTTGDAQTFTLRWTQSSNTFSEVSDTSGICTLSASSVRVNVDTDTDKIAFKFKFTSGKAGNCDVKATTTDDASASDTDTYTNEFSLAFYTELTIVTTSHSWSIIPGQSDILITEGTINITVTANANFNVQAKGSGDLTFGSYSIALSNVKMNYTGTAISVTTEYQNIPGLTNQASGNNIAVTFKLWLSAPTGLPAGDYTYVLTVQITQT